MDKPEFQDPFSHMELDQIDQTLVQEPCQNNQTMSTIPIPLVQETRVEPQVAVCATSLPENHCKQTMLPETGAGSQVACGTFMSEEETPSGQTTWRGRQDIECRIPNDQVIQPGRFCTTRSSDCRGPDDLSRESLSKDNNDKTRTTLKAQAFKNCLCVPGEKPDNTYIIYCSHDDRPETCLLEKREHLRLGSRVVTGAAAEALRPEPCSTHTGRSRRDLLERKVDEGTFSSDVTSHSYINQSAQHTQTKPPTYDGTADFDSYPIELDIVNSLNLLVINEGQQTRILINGDPETVSEAALQSPDAGLGDYSRNATYTRMITNDNLDLLLKRMDEFENRLTALHSMLNESVMQNGEREDNRHNNRKVQIGKCYLCRSREHLKKACPLYKRLNNKPSHQPSQKGRCFLCGSRDHFKNACPLNKQT